ncbi:MAG: gamma carbonic anhydrase family protein [Rhodospirillales bacterium]
MDDRFPDAAYIDPSARIFGNVVIGAGSSVWPLAVIRAETHAVEIGRFTNIQDFAMIHIGQTRPTIIGDYCSIAHRATLHGCTIGNNCLIGMDVTIRDGVELGDNCIVVSRAYVPEGLVVPANSLVGGQPAKVSRGDAHFLPNRFNALLYHRNALAYARGDHRAWTGPDYDAFVRDVRERLEAEYQALYPPVGTDPEPVDPLDEGKPLI